MTVRIVRLDQTCWGCPSQWDARDDEGNCYYIRYRWGHLTVDLVDNPDWFRRRPVGLREQILSVGHGGSLDGVLSEDELVELTASVLDFSTLEA